MNKSLIDMGSSQGFSKMEVCHIFSLGNDPLKKRSDEAGVEIITGAKSLRRRGEWDPLQNGGFVLGAGGRQTAWDRCLWLLHFGEKSILIVSV